ncbi:hypothetical protein PPSIR1_11701 [Plesiocystis pacifica SIR-1]|uniref:Uncharacterized protein n=1 Tax=Plesiocystis pacifica SIR-1 TaxID=391625 RepID=A6GJQ3_9BACT|nr:hypothetical protein PPSIR1_11701 [Plesiocystis pacifica SIR-1]
MARARASLRGGELNPALRGELFASSAPQHRHAARLLQAIDGGGELPVLAHADGPAAVEAEPRGEGIAGVRLPEPPSVAAEDPPEQPPVGTPARPEANRPEPDRPEPGAEAGAEAAPEEAPEPGPSEAGEADEPPTPGFDLWTAVVGEEPLLARLPPPPSLDEGHESLVPHRDPSLARGLVILTRLAIGEGSTGVQLELSGAGPVTVERRLLSSQRLLLWIDGAGAMPTFASARPRSPELAVTDVRRNEGRVEIEVELAEGWACSGAVSQPNGARVDFVSGAVQPG